MNNSKKISLDKESLCDLHSISKSFFSDLPKIYKNKAFKSGAKLTWTFITATTEQIMQRLASI